jgi:putative oxidoreductase
MDASSHTAYPVSMKMTTLQTASLFFLRLIVGSVFMWAGYSKWFVWSGAPADMSAAMINLIKLLSVVEPLGATAVLLGFLTRWAASGLAIIMTGSLYFVYLFQSAFFSHEKGVGMDYNLLILAGCLVLLAFGAGDWSVDAIRRRSSHAAGARHSAR